MILEQKNHFEWVRDFAPIGWIGRKEKRILRILLHNMKYFSFKAIFHPQNLLCVRPRTASIRFDLKQRRRMVLGGFPAVKVPIESDRKLVREKKFSNVSDFFSAAAQLTFLEWILSTLWKSKIIVSDFAFDSWVWVTRHRSADLPRYKLELTG